MDDLVIRYMAAWNGRDASAMDALVTDDVQWEDPAMPDVAIGPVAVRAFMKQSWATFPDLVFDEPDERFLLVDGDRVSWRWRMSGTFTGAPIDPPGFAPTGLTMEITGVDLWELRDGRIAVYRAFYDMNDLARQLGIVPPPGSRPERMMARMQRVQARAWRGRR